MLAVEVTRQRVAGGDVRDERSVPALVAVQDERNVGGEWAVRADHEHAEADRLDRVVQDRQFALGEVGIDVHRSSWSR